MLTEETWEFWVPGGEGKTVLKNRQSVYQLPTQQVNRMVVCGKCPVSGIDPELVSQLLRDGIDHVLHQVEVYREYGYVPEVSREKKLERGRRWREANEDKVREDREAKERDRRIKILKEGPLWDPKA
jgi:hypothetical protein